MPVFPKTRECLMGLVRTYLNMMIEHVRAEVVPSVRVTEVWVPELTLMMDE